MVEIINPTSFSPLPIPDFLWQLFTGQTQWEDRIEAAGSVSSETNTLVRQEVEEGWKAKLEGDQKSSSNRDTRGIWHTDNIQPSYSMQKIYFQ